jgi:hypothetical protein
MRIQNTPRATQRESYWLTQGEVILIGCLAVWRIFCCSSDIMDTPIVALLHSKFPGNCSIRIQNMAVAALFFHIGT